MKQPNILLITIDCLRADILGCYAGPAHSPQIDQLAARSVRYTQAFAHASFTKTTFPTIFSGTYPSEYGGAAAFDATRPSLVEELAQQGYQTLGVNSNPWLSRQFGFQRGYTRYVDLSSATPKAHSLPMRLVNHALGLVGGGLAFPPYPAAKLVTDTAVSLLQLATAPWFLWLHYMEAHWPYNLPRPQLFGPWNRRKQVYSARLARKTRQRPTEVTAAEKEALFTLHLAGVAAVDQEIGRLLAHVDGETAVMLTADHGEAFGEHGQFFHAPALYRENVHVPLLLCGPGITPQQVETAVVRHIDIPRTLLGAARIRPRQPLRGVNLYPAALGETAVPDLPAISESKTGSGRWLRLTQSDYTAILFVESATGQIKQRFLFHNQDISELENLAETFPDIMQVMEKTLLDHAVKYFGEKLNLQQMVETSTLEMQERLKALGYLD